MTGKRYMALALFSIAFGVEEAIIVLYLRHLAAFAGQAYALEIAREFCTLLVIGAIAWLAGASSAQRARAFCFAFGAWDIVYYLTLCSTSGFPKLADSDVLFLIPVPWIAPVWAPMAFALVLMLIGVVGVVRERSMLLAAGFILALLSFVYQTTFRVNAYPFWLFAVSLVLVLTALPLHLGELRLRRASR
jgi:hypothetical protein